MSELSSSLYLKNYRSDALRIRQRSFYNSTNLHSSCNSLQSASASSSTTNLVSLRPPVSSRIGLRNSSVCSSGYSGSNFSSTNSTSWRQHGSASSEYLSTPYSPSLLSYTTPKSVSGVLGYKKSFPRLSRSTYQYQRTYSGGAKVRCASADPDILALVKMNRKYPIVLKSSSKLSSCSRSPSYSRTPSAPSSRSASADRYMYPASAKLSDQYWSKGSAVTELAKNVAAYAWDNAVDSKTGTLRRPSFSRQSSCSSTTGFEDSASATTMMSAAYYAGSRCTSVASSVSIATTETKTVIMSKDDFGVGHNEDYLGNLTKYRDRNNNRQKNGMDAENNKSWLTPEDEQTLARVSSYIFTGVWLVMYLR